MQEPGLAVEVDVSGVTKGFASRGSRVNALDDVSLHLAPGEFVSLLGPSGCGKSTLLRIVAGLEVPSSGEVRVAGELVSGPRPDHGVVFQKPALFPWLNVMDNVNFGPRMRAGWRARKQSYGLAEDYIARVGLTGFEQSKVYELSGGMMHRVSLARALIHRPTLLLMDEPFAALDAQTRLSMQELVMSVWAADKPTVLFVTHDVEEALLLSDRVAVMTAGPGRVGLDVTVDIPRPRGVAALTSLRFVELKRQLLDQLHIPGSGTPDGVGPSSGTALTTARGGLQGEGLS